MSKSIINAGGILSAKCRSVSIPVFNWNSEEYGYCSLNRIFNIISNHELGLAVGRYDWGSLSGSTDVVDEEINKLPQIKIPSGIIGLRISLTNNYYYGRLQLNHVIESLPYTLGHFRPCKSNDVIVLIDENVSLLQVINDFENEAILINKEIIPCDEMIKLTSDPHCWLRTNDTISLSA